MSSVSTAGSSGRTVWAAFDSIGIDSQPWIHVSGMSPRTTGSSGFSASTARAKSSSVPKWMRTPGRFFSAKRRRFSTSASEGGPWLSPVMIMAR